MSSALLIDSLLTRPFLEPGMPAPLTSGFCRLAPVPLLVGGAAGGGAEPMLTYILAVVATSTW